jgi:hypothetical protein
MATVSVHEIWQPGRQGSIDENGVRRYTRYFRVELDNIVADPLEATTSGLLPALFSSYIGANGAVDIGATCRSITPKQDSQNPFFYEITYEYSSERIATKFGDNPLSGYTGGSQSQGQASDANPLLRPPEISGDMQEYQKPMIRDTEGKPPCASNKEKFENAIMIDDSRPIVTYVRNEAAFTYATWVLYNNAINKFIFNGRPARTVRCKIRWRKVLETGVWFYQVTYDFSIKDETWDLEELDQGTYELEANGNHKAILDETTAHPITSPVLLDGAGRKLPVDNSIPVNTTITANIVPGVQAVAVASNANMTVGMVLLLEGQEFVTITALGANTFTAEILLNHQAGSHVKTSGEKYVKFKPYRAVDFAPLNIVL